MSFVDDIKNAPDNSNSFELIPKGEYLCRLKKIERKNTKKGDGWYYSAEFMIVSEPYRRRIFFENFNWENPNEMAVEIGRGKFRELVRAAGWADVEKHKNLAATHKPLDDLQGEADLIERQKPFMVHLDIEVDEKWGDKNRAKYYAYDDGRAAAGPEAAKAAPADDANIPF